MLMSVFGVIYYLRKKYFGIFNITITIIFLYISYFFIFGEFNARWVERMLLVMTLSTAHFVILLKMNPKKRTQLKHNGGRYDDK